MIDLDETEGLEPPGKPDFRRVAKGVPLIKVDGKNVRYRRSSSVGKVLDDESGIQFWQSCTQLIGAAQRPDLMAEVSLLTYEADKGKIYDIAEQCLVTGKGRQRAVLGTAIHAMLDQIDSDADWTPAPQFQALCEAYVMVRDLFGLVAVDIECKCVNDEYRLAGTMDRRYRTTKPLVAPDGTIIPIGSILAGDTKTGRTLEYAGGTYATQVAGYVDSVRYDVQTDERSEFEPPTYKEWAVIFHVVPDDVRVEVYWIDLEAGRHGLALAQQVYEWRRRSDLLSLARIPLRIVPGEMAAPSDQEQPITASNSVTEASAVRSWLLERLEAVRQAGPDAVEALRRCWPAGVAGFKSEAHTEADYDEIDVALSQVEKEYSLSYPTADPRQPSQALRQRVWSDRWARPLEYAPDDAVDDAFRYAMADHPRRDLLEAWKNIAIADLDLTITDRIPLSHALYEFALAGDDWSDADLTEMLDGTLRAMGYDEGVAKLGHVKPEETPVIMSAAFGLTSGTCILLYNEAGKPIVRNIKTV